MEKKGRILIVDDDRDTQDVLRMVFDDYEYSVSQVNNGEEALKHLASANTEFPDLIILDGSMPLMNGTQFLNTIRKSDNSNLAQVPVLLSSANKSVQTDELTAQKVTVLNKPMDLGELMLKVDSLIASRKLH